MVEKVALNIIHKTKNIFFLIFKFFFAYGVVRQVQQANISAVYFRPIFFSASFFFRPVSFLDIFFSFETNFYLMFLFWPNLKAEL